MTKESGCGGRVRCPLCRYDLRGSVGTHCPECGARLQVVATDMAWGKSSAWLWIVIFAWTAIAAGFSALIYRHNALERAYGKRIADGLRITTEQLRSAARTGQPNLSAPRPASVNAGPTIETSDQFFVLCLALFCFTALCALAVVLWYRRRPCPWNLRSVLWSVSMATLAGYVILMTILLGTHRL